VRKWTVILCGGGVGPPALFWNGTTPPDSQPPLVSPADARVGRPATPVSYAGVARRTTRRAVAAGTVVGATAVGVTAVGVTAASAAAVSVAAPRCARVIDRYGRVVTVCP